MKLIPCRKIKYHTYDEAKKAISEWRQRRFFYKRGKRIERKVPSKIYKCRNCKTYHITRQK